MLPRHAGVVLACRRAAPHDVLATRNPARRLNPGRRRAASSIALLGTWPRSHSFFVREIRHVHVVRHSRDPLGDAAAPPIATYFVGGADEIPALVTALGGHLVHELSVDIKDGVRESSMVCAVLLAAEETEPLLDRLRGLASVVSAELA